MDVKLTALWKIMADRRTDWPTDRPVHREVSLPIMLIYLLFVKNDLKNKLFHINFPGTKCWSRWRPPTRRPSPSLPLLHLNLPPPLVVVAACHWHSLSADRIKLSPPLLDLTNKSLEPPTAGDMAATAAAKLRLENHLNMLKMKEIEMMKTVPVNRYVFSAFLVANQPLQFFFVRSHVMTTSFFSRCFRCKW